MIKSHVLVHHAANEDPDQPYTYVLALVPVSYLYNVNKAYDRQKTGVLTSVTSYFLLLTFTVSFYASAHACKRA